MQKPYRRAFGLYLVINVLIALSLTLPLAAILSHFWHYGLGEILGLWGLFVGIHLALTLLWIPRLASWLAREDAQRETKRSQRRDKKPQN